jgi:predicted PurR-regulated permease PerM
LHLLVPTAPRSIIKKQGEHAPDPVAARAGDIWWTRGRIDGLVLAVAAAGGVYLCYLLAVPFLSPLTWAVTLAVLFAPAHRWIESKLRGRGLAAMVSVAIVALIVVVPATFVAERLVEEAGKGAVLLQSKVESGALQRAIEAHPRLAPIGKWLEEQVDLPRTVGNLTNWLSSMGAYFVRGSVVQVIGFLLTFYLLFYFLRDRHAALRAVRRLSPLDEGEMSRLFARVVDIVHATIYGTVAVAAVQGFLGGLMFGLLGLPAPFLWGLVMGLLAIVPVLGAFVVWIPAAVFLALNGDWIKALVLAVWGGVVVGGIDNLLYPMLVGNRLRLHTVPAFISVVGGLALFGPSGVILGPLIVTLTLLLVEIWRERIAAAAPSSPDD